MLIDINAKIGQWPFKKLMFEDGVSLIRRMDQFAVDRSVVSSLNGIFYKNTQTANHALYEECKSSSILKERIIPFCIINPSYSGWKYDFNKCINDWGMRGVCVYPQYHDYSISDPELIELAVLAAENDVPVALTLRMVDFRQRSWLDIEREWALQDVLPLLKEVPDAKYLILNVANSTSLTDENLELFKRSNVLMDTSGRMLNRLSDHLKIFGDDKFAFGTHTPILDYCTPRLRIEYLDREYDESVKDKLKYQNASQFLNLS
ncbi:amidohydrolase family protein [Membranihabitans maritimus]|uniref:amidohydrolase family protein n=1 Tax=Membranihabitans maritimus TaxID=2904244 RepID=UPI001F327FE3|nr:amidohydrolase family protein [Membranihabitans maritimus]